MRIAEATYLEVLHVVRNVSQTVHREIFSDSRNENPFDYARRLVMAGGPLHMVAITDDGEPVASIGAVNTGGPFDWWPWCFATPRFREIALPMTRFVRKQFYPSLQRLGMRRASCFSLAANTEAHKWLEAIGGQRAGEPFPLGKNGDSFVRFVWYNTDSAGQKG